MNGHTFDRRINFLLGACAVATLLLVLIVLPTVRHTDTSTTALRDIAATQHATDLTNACRAKITADNEVAFGEVFLAFVETPASPERTQKQTDAIAELARTQALRKKINDLCK